MSIYNPKITTIGGGVEIVHVIPIETEIDRAVRVFEVEDGFKANKAYILSGVFALGLETEEEANHYLNEVRRRLEAQGIKVEVIPTHTMSILDVISKVSKIVKAEREKGNIVYVNMSAGGPFVSVGTALATMVQDARLYYVRSAKLSLTEQERWAHGNAIVTEPQVHFLENFKIQLPDARSQLLLVELYKQGEMRTSDILKFLHESGEEGFEDDPEGLRRSDKIGMLMRLNKGITGKLEAAGYIVKEKRGRENLYMITDSGKYVACVSGLVEAAPRNPFN
jgi:Domain of unknown function (DUF6293)/DUF6293 C-terminal winged helix domain